MASNSTKQLSFVADAETLELINELKREMRAPTAAAVFRKALSLAKVAVDESKSSGGIVTVRGKANPEGVSIPLRA